MSSQRTILFYSINSPGHINSSLGIADKLVQQYGSTGVKCVFVVCGELMDKIRNHEVIEIDDTTKLQDYELKSENDLKCSGGRAKTLAEQEGRSKKTFSGAKKWPQMFARLQPIMRRGPVECFQGVMEIFMEKMLIELDGSDTKIANVIEKVNPDLMIVDALLTPPSILARHKLHGTPWVRLNTTNPLIIFTSAKYPNPPGLVGAQIGSKQQREQMRQHNERDWYKKIKEWGQAAGAIEQIIRPHCDAYERMLRARGIEYHLNYDQFGPESTDLNVYLYPAVLDYDREDDIISVPARWIRSSSLVRTHSDSESLLWRSKLEQAAQNKEAIVYFSLGSLASGEFRLIQRYVDMFKRDKKRLYVISKGANGSHVELSSDNMIGENYLPQTCILEHANLAIVHGGNNTLSECMHFGVPMIVVPVFMDQIDNAQRVVDLNFGKRLDMFECSEHEMSNAIDETLKDDKLIERMKHVSKLTQTSDDLSDVARLVHKLASEKKLDQACIDAYKSKHKTPESFS